MCTGTNDAYVWDALRVLFDGGCHRRTVPHVSRLPRQRKRQGAPFGQGTGIACTRAIRGHKPFVHAGVRTRRAPTLRGARCNDASRGQGAMNDAIATLSARACHGLDFRRALPAALPRAREGRPRVTRRPSLVVFLGGSRAICGHVRFVIENRAAEHAEAVAGAKVGDQRLEPRLRLAHAKRFASRRRRCGGRRRRRRAGY